MRVDLPRRGSGRTRLLLTYQAAVPKFIILNCLRELCNTHR